MHKKIFTLFIIFIAVSLLAGCQVFNKIKVLEGPEREAVMEFANPMGENLITGLLNQDYAVFSADFDDSMLGGMDQTAFGKLTEMLASKLGTYQSHEVSTVLQDDKFTTVVYNLIYEKDSAVTMRIVYTKDEPHKVTGLWFDSPELRKE